MPKAMSKLLSLYVAVELTFHLPLPEAKTAGPARSVSAIANHPLLALAIKNLPCLATIKEHFAQGPAFDVNWSQRPGNVFSADLD
jgi:hypothetical protein